jgi:hypothetical protein
MGKKTDQNRRRTLLIIHLLSAFCYSAFLIFQTNLIMVTECLNASLHPLRTKFREMMIAISRNRASILRNSNEIMISVLSLLKNLSGPLDAISPQRYNQSERSG